MKKYTKILSLLFILLGVTGLFFLFYHIFSFEKFAVENIDFYYPTYTDNNRGGWNFFAYFTFISNAFADFYLILLGLAGFNVKCLRKIVDNSYVQGLITVYIFITGAVYSVLLGPYLKPYPWDGPLALSNVVNFYNHVVMPLIMTVLWFFPHTKQLLDKKFIWIVLIFPGIYFVFSLVRGAVIEPVWYPYPFLNPKALWEYLFDNKVFDPFVGWSLFLAFLVVICILFIVVAIALRYFRNKQLQKNNPQE